MCIPSLTIEQLETLKTYKYESTNKSIAYNYLIGPIINQFVKMCPSCKVSPLFLSFLALLFNLISFLIINQQAYNDFTYHLSPLACILFAVFHFLFIIVDNFDRVQSKHSGYTPYHILVSHWVSVFIVIIIAYNVSHILLLDTETPFSIMIFVGIYLGYFATSYEEYALGELHLSYFNGVNEGNIIIVVLALIAGIFGSDIYENDFLFGFTIGEWFALITLIGSVHVAVMCLLNIYFAKGFLKVVTSLIEWAICYNVFIVPFAMIGKDSVFFADNFWLIMLTVSFLFARNAVDLQVKIFTKQPFSWGFTVIFLNLLLPVTFVLRRAYRKMILSIYAVSSIGFATEMGMLFVIRSIEMMTYLNTNLFCPSNTELKIDSA